MNHSTTVLITGVAGFLGVNLANRLLEQGYKVIGVDDFSTGQRQHIKFLSQSQNFSFIEQSINLPLSSITTQIHQIYNLACPASPPFYQQLALHTLKTCSIGVENLLQLAKIHSAKLVHASTSEIYGQPEVWPQNEHYWGHVNPIGVRSCYDEGKRFAESLITNFGQQHDLEVKIARIFNTYGPGMRVDDGRVISNFLLQAQTGQPLTIFGTGNQTRSLCYVDDLITGLQRLMQLQQAYYPGPINLGNSEEISILHLAHQICQAVGVAPIFTHLPLPEDDPARRCPDINLAKTLLAWEPQIDLKDGLERLLRQQHCFSGHPRTCSAFLAQ